jgi:hypothetical protein
MASNFEGGCIVVEPDGSKEAAIAGGRQILDFRGIRHDPHVIARVGTVINFASGSKGETEDTTYTARLEDPGRIGITPPLSAIARHTLAEYFGVQVVDWKPALEAVS